MKRHTRKHRFVLGIVIVLALTIAYIAYHASKEIKPPECWANNPGTGPTMEEAIIWEKKCRKYYPREK